MKVVGVIPARWASTRFPGKSLAMLCGKPLIQRVFEVACGASRLSLVIVATDDRRIARAVQGFGGKAVMTRTDHPSGTDRVAEALRDVDAEIAINLQGDEPFVDPGLIDRLADVMVSEAGWDMATAATAIRDQADLVNPSVVKVVFGEDNRALFFSRSVIPFDRDKAYGLRDGLYWRHLGIYAYRREFLERLVAAPPCLIENVEKLEQLRAMHMGARIKVIETESAGAGIDTPDDLARAERAMRDGTRG